MHWSVAIIENTKKHENGERLTIFDDGDIKNSGGGKRTMCEANKIYSNYEKIKKQTKKIKLNN